MTYFTLPNVKMWHKRHNQQNKQVINVCICCVISAFLKKKKMFSLQYLHVYTIYILLPWLWLWLSTWILSRFFFLEFLERVCRQLLLHWCLPAGLAGGCTSERFQGMPLSWEMLEGTIISSSRMKNQRKKLQKVK